MKKVTGKQIFKAIIAHLEAYQAETNVSFVTLDAKDAYKYETKDICKAIAKAINKSQQEEV